MLRFCHKLLEKDFLNTFSRSNLGVKEHLENLHRLLFKDFSPYRKSKKEGVEKIMEKVMEKIKPLVSVRPCKICIGKV